MIKTRRQPYTYTLAAGAEQLIPFVGNFFRLISWTGETGALQIALGDGEALNQIDVGDDWGDGDAFNAVRIYNSGTTSGVIKFVVGNGASRNWAFQTSNTLIVDVGASSVLSGGISPTVTKGAITIAARSNRREIELYNSGAYPVWVGASTVDGAATPAIGTLIDVGVTKVLTTSAKLYFHSIGGTGAISYNEHVGS
jgi:hypothetical protein